MSKKQKCFVSYTIFAVVSLIAPYLAPAYHAQMAIFWLMILLSLTWDIMGGQMGYNSFGNIIFFGIGMYVTAVVQRDLFYTVDEYQSVAGGVYDRLTPAEYLGGLGLGLTIGAIVCVAVAAILGAGILRLRGQYFAICTLGLGIAVGEIASGISYIGAGAGIQTPIFPDDLGNKNVFFYYYLLILTVITFFSLKALYAAKFGLIINSIRDNEDKAEAMGIHTIRYKTVAWCVSAFFLSFAGGAYGNLIGFIDPLDVAFSGATLGVWMVLMAILGGKGTIWGPVIGAMIFHITQELFWTYLLGWQRVALGAFIVITVVFFPQGIMGWMRTQWPERYGIQIETKQTEGVITDEFA